jgi:arsenite methyltransferase
VSGALAERAFVKKLERVGFEDIEVVERHPFGVDEMKIYPLFTDELIDLTRSLIPPDRQQEVATSVVVKARRGG